MIIQSLGKLPALGYVVDTGCDTEIIYEMYLHNVRYLPILRSHNYPGRMSCACHEKELPLSSPYVPAYVGD